MQENKTKRTLDFFRFILLTIVLSIANTFCYYDYLLEGYSASAIARGNSMIGAFSNTDCIYSNPAGLIGISKLRVKTNYQSAFGDDLTRASFEAVLPVGDRAVFFLMVPIQRMSGIAQTTVVDNQYVVTDELQDLRSGFSMGLGLGVADILSIGIRAKYYNLALADKTGSGFTADVGILLHNLFELANVGLTYENVLPNKLIWSTGKREEFEGQLQVGAAIDFQEVSIFTDYSFLTKTNKFGVSLKLSDFLLLQGGLNKCDEENKFFSGISLNFDGIKIDYAFSPDSELGNSHNLSLAWEF